MELLVLLNENQITTIVYENKNKLETSARAIIPTSIPATVVRAIDVEELSEVDRVKMNELYSEYRGYTKQFVANMFSFENWVEHTKGVVIEPKWRAFKVENIK
jgi:hypothetical protein